MLQIFCCFLVWLLLGLLFGNICQTVSKGVAHVRRLHQIPCSRCAFFTGDYRLKCTVHPFTAMSESAIGCRDFESTSYAETKLMVQPGCSKCTGNSRKKRSSIFSIARRQS